MTCRPQPYRLDPQKQGIPDDLKQNITNADEMFQILFEDIASLCAKVDALSAVGSTGSTAGGGACDCPPGSPGRDGEDGAQGFPGAVGPVGPIGPAGASVPAIFGNLDPQPDSEPAWPMMALPSTNVVTQTTTSTGTQNDFTLLPKCGLLLCNNASLLSFTGLSAGQEGQILQIVSIGAGQVDTLHANAGSAVANRFINISTSGPASAAAGAGTLTYVYSVAESRWRLLNHYQGDWISVAYASGNYTADAGTWTVDSGDVLGFRYYLEGRVMTVSNVTTFTTTSGVSLRLFVLIPAGFTHGATLNQICFTAPNNLGAAGIVQVNSTVSTTKIGMLKMDLSAWADFTNANSNSFTITFPVD